MASYKKAHNSTKTKAIDKSATAASYKIEYKNCLTTKQIACEAQGLLVK
jgi:hypothetical protein